MPAPCQKRFAAGVAASSHSRRPDRPDLDAVAATDREPPPAGTTPPAPRPLDARSRGPPAFTISVPSRNLHEWGGPKTA
jgi:hypothetical protein